LSITALRLFFCVRLVVHITKVSKQWLVIAQYKASVRW